MAIINGIDFGNLVRVYVGGVKAYVDEFYRERIPEAVLVGEYDEARPPYTKLRVTVHRYPRKVWFYPVERKDAIKLARVLAQKYPEVSVEAKSRSLVRFTDGVEGKHYTLNDYYDEITPEELNETTLE